VDHETSRRRTALGIACESGAADDAINKLIGGAVQIDPMNSTLKKPGS
jgi:hypothetical protein